MKTSTRYSFISLFIFIFVVLAPLLVLYVSGTKLNFNDRDTSSTGIFDAKSNPTDATLLVDGKEHSATPAIARFLNQGEYVFTLKKEGYYDWSKRLPIEAGQVNYAQSGVDEIQLIKKTEPFLIEASGVSDFKLINDNLWYTFGNDLVYTYINDPANKKSIKNIASGPLSISELRDKKHLLITGANASLLVNTSGQAVSALPFQITEPSHLQMISDDTAIYLSDNELYSYNFIAKNTVKLDSAIVAFTALGTTGYFVKADGHITTAVWNGTNFADEQLLTSGVSVASNELELLITDRKELFFKNGIAGLYRVGQKMDLVSMQIESVQLDLTTNELVFISSGELWFYNFLSNRPQLLTRSTSTPNTFIIHSNIGYGFVGTSNGLEAIETDTRDQQNRYQLLTNKPVWRADMTSNQKTVVALYDSSLIMLEVRN